METLIAAIVVAILSINGRIPPRTAKDHAQALVAVAEASGEDPWLLVGVIWNESDWRSQIVSPDGLDCGLCQTRVTGSKFTCQQLVTDVSLSMRELARELAQVRADAAVAVAAHPEQFTGTHDEIRYVLNHFNSGDRKANCGPKNDTCQAICVERATGGNSPTFDLAGCRLGCKVADERCRTMAKVANNYWVRVLCFADAAKHGESGVNCRKAKEPPRPRVAASHDPEGERLVKW